MAWCLAFRSDETIDLRSKSGKSLARFFPEVVAMMRSLPIKHFTLDGELIIPIGFRLSEHQGYVGRRLSAIAAELYEEVGEIAMTLINAKIKRARAAM